MVTAVEPEHVKARLASLMAAIEAFEASLADQDVPLDIVSDFKSSVDDLRLRLWGLLTARSAEDHLAFRQRFRLRRLRELCLQVGLELQAGEVPQEEDELHKLVVAARVLVTAAGPLDAKHTG
ncbi:MAG: hypothetical protein OEY20_01515 [Gemmatimonadota bacterium]|nr:hypothetical protein [Gemmatimonadota bacterium]MDH4350528.1 hypothetical protein [Gemmatimonadota bacterium]MDH5195910.1 hypothetical protein [Gemmatimonadota bacterium]